MTTHQCPELEWTYRVAQNPRFVWILGMLFELWIVAIMLESAFTAPAGERLADFCVAAGLSSLIIMMWTVGGLPPLTRTPRIDAQVKRIPSNAFWFVHIPVCVAFAGIGLGVILTFERPASIDSADAFSLCVILVGSYAMIAVAPLTFLVAGYHRVLEFRSDGLCYERGWFRAYIPWTAIADLRPVSDANVKNPGDVTEASRFTVRAGVQITLRENAGAKILRKTMLHRIDGRRVVGVDCSSYRIDANTLINAIYLLTHNPELRAQLDHPSGAEIFAGPSWNTRRAMRVGDTWDRGTDEIIPSSDRQSA